MSASNNNLSLSSLLNIKITDNILAPILISFISWNNKILFILLEKDLTSLKKYDDIVAYLNRDSMYCFLGVATFYIFLWPSLAELARAASLFLKRWCTEAKFFMSSDPESLINIIIDIKKKNKKLTNFLYLTTETMFKDSNFMRSKKSALDLSDKYIKSLFTIARELIINDELRKPSSSMRLIGEANKIAKIIESESKNDESYIHFNCYILAVKVIEESEILYSNMELKRNDAIARNEARNL